jgi:hypothetical protein
VVLIDNANLESQLLGLIWRANKIDHQSGEHDDIANGAAGALYLASKNQVINVRAVPIGIGSGIGAEIRKAGLGSSRMSHGVPVRFNYHGDDDEP